MRIRAPSVEPRKGPALRCADLTIGYPNHEVASDIHVEIEHGTRVAIVGDNGQGKTTFLRTVVSSLEPLEGQIRWGYGCEIGVYAQHVYTSLPEKRTVLEYLEYVAAPGTKSQALLDLAGSFLFRGDHVNKSISVLSGGERARLCLAGLLLSQHNVLVLDEPGNHLDVDTVDALAEALNDYQGTVLFTSHDRHFMKRVATAVIEVRAGRVVNYRVLVLRQQGNRGGRARASREVFWRPSESARAAARSQRAVPAATGIAQGSGGPGTQHRPARRSQTPAERATARNHESGRSDAAT